MTERRATLAGLSTNALLGLEQDRVLEAPLPNAMHAWVQVGDPVLAYFDQHERLVGWFLPEVGIGVDTRG